MFGVDLCVCVVLKLVLVILVFIFESVEDVVEVVCVLFNGGLLVIEVMLCILVVMDVI